MISDLTQTDPRSDDLSCVSSYTWYIHAVAESRDETRPPCESLCIVTRLTKLERRIISDFKISKIEKEIHSTEEYSCKKKGIPKL